MTRLHAAIAVTLLTLGSAIPGSAAAQSFTITINPGAYTGVYQVNPANEAGFGFVTGTQVLSLPAGDYDIDTGAEVASSSFGFTVNASGQITNITSGSATASGATLTLNNVTVTIDPRLYAGNFYVSPWHFLPRSGPQTVVLVPDLTYYVDDGAYVGGPQGSSSVYFSVDANGLVTSGNTGAATGGAGVLTLNNVLVHIAPGSYTGTYFVSGGESFAGPALVELIPTLLAHVYIDNQFPVYFLPTASSVTPSLVSLSDGANLHPFVLTIASARDIAAMIVASIQAFASAGSIAGPQANNLITSVNTAASKIGVNDAAAVAIVGATLNKLDAFLKGGKITQAAHDALVAEIDTLLSALP